MSGMDIAPEVFSADYEGEPGRRTFFLHSKTEEGTVSFLVEKQQVAVLAERMRELLLLIDSQDTVRSTNPERDPALTIVLPAEAEWRVGAMGISYDEEEDVFAVLLKRVEDEGEEEAEAEAEAVARAEDEPDAFDVRFLLRRDQVRAFVLHTIAVVDEGRPICQLCGLPMDPAGHKCPASNGHRLSG